MVDNNNTGMLFREINIWRSNTYSRLDRTFGGASFCRLWRVTPGMHYNIATGLHQPQYPSGISPDTSAPSDTGILHYGFSSVKNLAFKYFIYESHGQAQVHGQWALDMFIDEGGMQLESLPKEMFPAELYTENEQKPSPILFDDFFELIQPYKEKAVHSQPPIILSNDIVTGPLGEKFLWDYMLEGINNILGLDCRNVLNIQKDWHLMPRDFSEKISNHIKQNYSDSEIIIQNATWMDTLCPEKYTIAFLQDALRPMGGANPQQEKNLKQAKLVVTNSHYTASFYPEYYPVVIPIGIDQKIFHPIDKQQVRQEFGFDNRQTGIFVGSYSDIKGWVEVQQLIEKYPNIFWIIVTKDLYKLSDTLNSKHYSRIDHGVLIKLLNCADFFILGSPIETECLAALQAGFCNVPIVMHKTGIFANMTLGQQSKLGCFDDNLEKAMLTVIQNLSQHSPLEELISQGLTIENTIEQWKKLLDKVQSELTSPNVENKTVEIKANEVSPELNIIKKCIIDISDQYAIKEEKEWDVNPWTFWAKGTFYQRLRLKDVAEASLRLFQGNIIEIGAGVGEQTIRFAELAREYGRKVIVIDPWIINQQHYSYLPVDDFQVFDYLSRNYKPYIDVIRSSSLDSDIVEFLKKQEIAFAFVDGLHLYEPCKIDISSVWHASVMAVDDLLQLPEECNTAFREYTNINNSYWNKSLNEGYIIPKII